MDETHDRTPSIRLLHELQRAAPLELARIAPDRPDLLEKLDTYLNEVPVALDLVAPLLDSTSPRRILEVGSGIGAVTACLRADGHDVVAIEPAGPGFEDMRLLQQTIEATVAALRSGAASSDASPLPIGVDDLDPASHGRFDVVFSANVLEHVPDPISALERMQSVLVEGGVQRHVCPNYAFPYEPHFFLPLVPFGPSLTRLLLPSRITQTGLWESLNFVTARQVRRWARRASAEVRFDRGVLAEAVERFLADPVFAERHAGLGRVVRLLQRLGVVPLLRRLPAGLVSPMRFTVAASARDGRVSP